MKELLLEKSRSELLDKSKKADVVKSYGTTRYGRKDHQHLGNTTKSLDNLDFNALFKADLLDVFLPVLGETDNYTVEVFFDKICSNIKRQVSMNNNVCEYKCVYRALVNAINEADIFVSCTCDDFKYRQAFYASKGRYNSGQPQIVPSKSTNPNDSKGAGCKHIMKVLSDLDWALNVATCINNYITFMEEDQPDKYQRIIFPAIYGMSYEQALDKGIVGQPEIEEPELEEPIEEPEEETTEEEEEV